VLAMVGDSAARAERDDKMKVEMSTAVLFLRKRPTKCSCNSFGIACWRTR